MIRYFEVPEMDSFQCWNFVFKLFKKKRMGRSRDSMLERHRTHAGINECASSFISITFHRQSDVVTTSGFPRLMQEKCPVTSERGA